MGSPFVFRCAAVALQGISVSFTQKVKVLQVLPPRLRSATTICAHGVSCPHPAVHFTRVRGRRVRACGEILDHGAVEANLSLCGWSAVVIGRESSPHWPDAVPAVDDMFMKVVHLRASEAAVSHDRPLAASPRRASVTVGRRSAAPSGDVILPEAAAGWASQ